MSETGDAENFRVGVMEKLGFGFEQLRVHPFFEPFGVSPALDGLVAIAPPSDAS